MIGIKAISTFFANSNVMVDEIPGRDIFNQNEASYFDDLGIDEIVQAEGMNSYDLALSASKRVLEDHQIDPAEVGMIIYIQDRLPEYFISSTSARLQHELNAENAISFSISDLGCTDMTMALKLAKEHLESNAGIKNVLICYGHKQYAATRFRYPVTINGDGGLAMVVSDCDVNQIVDIEIKSNGKYWDLFQVDYFDRSFDDYHEVCTNQRNYGFELPIVTKMNIAEINDIVLQRNNITLEDVDHFILQNLSQRAFDYTETSLNIKLTKSCNENLKRYGHLGPLDVIFNLKTGIESGDIKPGEKVLIMNNSPVAAWSSILVVV